MSISGISNSATSFSSSATTSKGDETIEQLAQQGDPVAIAELKAEEQGESPAKTGAREPGKGDAVDQYV